MKEVAYLLGAGASRNALPIVKEMPGRLLGCRNKLNAFKFPIDLARKEEARNKQIAQNDLNKIVLLFDKIILESEGHASIDTYAKKLYIKHDRQRLDELKLILLIFFQIEQLNKPDNRYDSFWASILLTDPVIKLPSNVRIISWNYDYQLEKSFSEFIFEPQYKDILQILNVRPINEKKYESNKFTIYKLNGTTIPMHTSGDSYVFKNEIFNTEFNADFVNNLTYLYDRIFVRETIRMDISFAWERSNTLIPMLKNSFKEVETLIIIGYSFPFFNREIDFELINSMTNLKRIYIQSPEADNVYERINSIMPEFYMRNINVHKIFDLEQFHLPWEI